MSVVVKIKDFGYSTSDSRHFGVYSEDSESDESNWDRIEEELEENVQIYHDPLLIQEELVRAVSLYEFQPENGNELPLEPNQEIYVNNSRDFGGWLVAYNLETGATGLVPSQYVVIVTEEEEEEEEEGEQSLSEQVQNISITEEE